MKKITALSAVLAISATTAFAGSPEVVVDEPMPEVFVEEAKTGGSAVLIMGGLVLLAAALAASDSDDDT
jgi:hypothetical protein